MTFEDSLYEANYMMEERTFNEANKNTSEREILCETVKLQKICVSSKNVTLLQINSKEGAIKEVLTNKPAGFFEGLKDRTVYISGLKTFDNKKCKEKWFIRSCIDVTDREESLANSDLFTEEEKTKFDHYIEKFSPEIQHDLCKKKMALADKMQEIQESDTSELTLYKEPDELDAYYNTVKKVIPKEFRDAYEQARYRMQKYNILPSEKRNYIKQMADILDFDWVGDADYKLIDVEAVRKKVGERHIGHRNQLEEIYTELEAANISKKAPKIMAFIGHPDTGVNQLAELIASSIGRGYSIINLAGIHTKDTAAFTGTSKIYENARSGLLYERIKEAGIRGTLIIENYDLCDSEIRNILVPIIENKKFFDQFVEVEMDLSNMMVIVICSDIKDIPMSLRANMRHIYFQDAEENEIIETINKIIVPRYCSEYGIAFPKRISDECCRTLIYKFANMDMNKLDDVIRSVIVKTVTKGGRKFSDSNIRSFNEFGDYDKIRNAYVRDITAVEHKFFTCYDEYPKCICNRAIKLFEILNWGSDESQKEYARDVIHYIANIFMGETKPLVVGSVIEELNKTHYLQNGFGEKIEAAILSKELEKNTNKMMIIGLNGSAGTGKSTTAVSIASALQRNFIKINVGGASCAEIIKGVNKTVHNAGPSMIVKELAKSGHGCYSDVIILDEVDKAEPGFFNALYEFLDPNEEFIYDQYLECHIPKNNFLVVLTFNDSSCIPLPIKDRMEIVEYSNYSIQDKKMIVANYILPKLKKKFGIGRLTIDDDALDLYAYHYDVIPGMRSAERDFEFILMSIARSGSGRFSDIVNIDKKLIMGVLGKMRTSGLNDIPPCSVGKFGMAQALAITSEGIGVSTAVETVINPYQEKNIVVTGLLEGSCLESVSVACCFVNNYIQKELPKLHIHMTDAVRKDGPSAGITIVMSILSCMLGKTIPNVAFTGSIDLYGNIGPVGGVFEKCIAAERTSVDKVIVPSECYRSLVDRKEIERLKVEVVPADTVEEVIRYVWGKEA